MSRPTIDLGPAEAQRPRHPPWWTVAALGGLLLLPSPWFGLALAGVLGASVLRSGARRLVARRRAAHRETDGAVSLGRDRAGRMVVLEDRQLAAHGVILGASGAGKSTTLLRVLCDRVARGLPVVALDLKGSPGFAQVLVGAAARAGRPCVVWSLDGDTHWNPLAHGNPTELKDKLIATERFTEPHYRRAAERYLQTALTVLGTRRPARAPTLGEVVALCEPRRLAAAARTLPGPLRERVTDYVAGLSPDQVSAVRGLGTRLAIITESHVGRLLEPAAGSGTGLDLRAALRGDVVAVFSLNSSTYGSLAAQIGTMAVQDIVGAAGARLAAGAGVGAARPAAGAGVAPGGTGPRGTDAALASVPPGLVAIDEFSALGADQILALFARGREAGVSVLLATQELTDLDRAARGLRDQVIGNTALKIVHRQDVPASAHAVAQMVGSERVWEETRHFGATGGSAAIGPRGTRREVERFRIHPDAIASLPTGAAVLITKVPRAEVRVVQVTPPALAASAPGTGQLVPAAALPRDLTPPSPARVHARGPQAAARRSNAPRSNATPPEASRPPAPRPPVPRPNAPRTPERRDPPRSPERRGPEIG
ncbi:MAG: conjugal transfer pilus assembly protein TraD [Solirubrobacteraceae bacterium]|nr:conjugal transfer pilus assembly protein TraD [Solirubrobacteraceae bacterium]